MDSGIQLIGDDYGLAVLGHPTNVDAFLRSEELPSRPLDLRRLGTLAGRGATVTQTASQAIAESGRWVKLTEESAHAIKKYGLMRSTKTGLSMGVVQAKGAQGIKGIVQFAKGPGTLALNPAVLSGAAGVMSQLAMQQAMDEITEYLAKIDAKVDDILRAQKDAVLADMIGVDLVVADAMAIRESAERVSEITWSTIQTAPLVIARTQGYALLQLDGLADKLERQDKLTDFAKTVDEAEPHVQEWLAVLARCFQLQDAVSVLELDRVLDADPDELDRHRLGIRTARQNRIERISTTTGRLLSRMSVAADLGTADGSVLLHRLSAQNLVRSSNRVASAVIEFQRPLGISAGHESREVRRWLQTAVEVTDRALETGAERLDSTLQRGSRTVDRARATTAKITADIAERVPWRRDDGGHRPTD